MTNRYHLVVETVEGNLSLGMRQLNGNYTQTVNGTHGHQRAPRAGVAANRLAAGAILEPAPAVENYIEFVRLTVIKQSRRPMQRGTIRCSRLQNTLRCITRR